jgi:glycosyltransferase involved in cell wall biosynthesis
MQTFVVPALDGPPTGGTLFNARLIAALRVMGREPGVVDADAVLRRPPSSGTLWIDSLFFAAVPSIAAAAGPSGRVGLLVHWLPSLVTHPHGITPGQLTPDERSALEAAAAFVVPSRFMAETLIGLGLAPSSVRLVEPGYEPPSGVGPPRSDRSACDVVVVANLVEGKEVATLLRALAEETRGERLEVTVIGGRPDPSYAKACAAAAAVARGAGLRVQLVGPLEPDACLARVAEADILASASRMESFGMAIADARACGIPVVARRGGNVEHLVVPEAGGTLVDDVSAVARACLELAGARTELERRRELARAQRIVRPWSAVAADFLAAARAG